MSRRTLIVFFGTMAAIVVVASVALSGTSSPDTRPGLEGSTHSTGPAGARALRLWLETLGYDARPIENGPFSIPSDAKVLFVIDPSTEITERHAVELDNWVQGGGTLVLSWSLGPALGSLDRLAPSLKEQPLVPEAGHAVPAQPLLTHPVVNQVAVRADWSWDMTSATDAVPYLVANKEIVMASRRVGSGRVYALSTSYPLSNEGIAASDNTGLVLNLLSQAPPGSIVAFDEYHHGFGEPDDLVSLILHRPWGWAILYAAAACLVFAFLWGRRFGRPIALASASRRSSVEYVHSMASLLQRSKNREPVARYFAGKLKQDLGRPFGLRGEVDDAALADRVRGALGDPAAADRLRLILERLGSGSRIPDSRLLELIKEAQDITAKALNETGQVRRPR